MSASHSVSRFNLSATAAAAAILVSLTACGGGGGSATPLTISGRVIDGYIQGATVCLDLNANLQCDTGEPTTTSGEDGSYSFSYSGSIDGVKVLAAIPVGAIDSELGVVTQSFDLLAPAESATTVTPLTTLVANQMTTRKVGAQEAEQAIKAQFNLQAPTLLGYDFKKAGDAETLQVAQVVAAAMATVKTNMNELNDSKSLGMDKKEVLQAVIAEVKSSVLPQLISGEGKATVDPAGKTQAQFVQAVSTKADVTTVLEGRVQQVVAQSKTGAGAVTNMEALFKEGFFTVELRSGDYLDSAGKRIGMWNGFSDALLAEWNTYDAAKGTKIQSKRQVWLPSGVNGEKWYGVYEDNGVRHVFDGKTWLTAPEDTFTNFKPSFKDNCMLIPLAESSTEGTRVCVVAKDVSGKKMADFIKDDSGKSLVCKGAEGETLPNCDPNQTFPSGSVGYDLTFTETINSYEVFTGSRDWSGYDFKGNDWSRPGAVVPTVRDFLNSTSVQWQGNNCNTGFQVGSVQDVDGVLKGTFKWGKNVSTTGCNDAKVSEFTETTTFVVEKVGGKDVIRTFVPVLYKQLNPGDVGANEFVFAAVEKELVYFELDGRRAPNDAPGAKETKKTVIGIFSGDYKAASRATTLNFTGNIGASFQVANKTLFEAAAKVLRLGAFPYP